MLKAQEINEEIVYHYHSRLYLGIANIAYTPKVPMTDYRMTSYHLIASYLSVSTSPSITSNTFFALIYAVRAGDKNISPIG